MGWVGCFSRQHAREYVLQEEEINSTDVSLGYVANDLLLFFYEFTKLDNAKKEIEKKYGIEPQEHNCWTEDDIKKAWKETKTMGTNSRRRRHCSVIMLQVVKSLVCDTCKQNAAQKNRDATTVEQGCETTPNSEDRIIQSNAELETAGAAGGVEQMLGEENKLSKASRPTESDSGVASGSPLSASSTDEAPSPAEVNPFTNSSNNYEQRKDDDDYELCYSDVHDKENAGCKNGLRSDCGISQRMKGNAEHRSTQSNAEPQQTEQTKDTAKQQSGADSGATKRKSTDSGATKRKSTDSSATKRKYTDNAGLESLLSTSGERDDSKEVPKYYLRSHAREANSQTVYIRIPFSVMSGNESPSSIDTVVPGVSPTYKLIDRVPNLTEIRKRKSYAMLYDNRTRNAAWVYEILNSETLQTKVNRANVFSADQSIHPFYRTPDDLYPHPYVRGHLAAAANHRWCRKACDDTFLMSNISPQHQDLNNSCWKTLENDCQTLAEETNIRNVHVYSGPLYLPGANQKILVTEIRDQVVPTHFFKVIIVEHKDRKVEHEDGKVEHEDGKVELKCYVTPNDASGHKYTVSIEVIERASGLIFRENSCSGGGTETKPVTWTGENKDDKPVTTHVKISTPHA